MWTRRAWARRAPHTAATSATGSRGTPNASKAWWTTTAGFNPRAGTAPPRRCGSCTGRSAGRRRPGPGSGRRAVPGDAHPQHDLRRGGGGAAAPHAAPARRAGVGLRRRVHARLLLRLPRPLRGGGGRRPSRRRDGSRPPGARRGVVRRRAVVLRGGALPVGQIWPRLERATLAHLGRRPVRRDRARGPRGAACPGEAELLWRGVPFAPLG